MGDKPLLLIAASPEPHYAWTHGDRSLYDASQLKLPPNWIDTPETRDYFRRYLAETSFLDSEVGRLRELLHRHSQLDGSAFFFTSEQGASFPYAKWTCYEAGVHTGLIVRWPGRVAANSVANALVDYTDVVPTFIELAGGQPPGVLDGQSFKPVLLGEHDPGKEYTFSMQTTQGEPWGGDYFGVRGARDSRYTYIINFTPKVVFENHLTRYGDGFFNSWREAAWHDKEADRLFLGYITRPKVELYDRQQDPYELKNLAGNPDMAEVQERLAERLAGWMRECGDRGQETELEAFEHQWKREEERRRKAAAP